MLFNAFCVHTNNPNYCSVFILKKVENVFKLDLLLGEVYVVGLMCSTPKTTLNFFLFHKKNYTFDMYRLKWIISIIFFFLFLIWHFILCEAVRKLLPKTGLDFSRSREGFDWMHLKNFCESFHSQEVVPSWYLKFSFVVLDLCIIFCLSRQPYIKQSLKMKKVVAAWC